MLRKTFFYKGWWISLVGGMLVGNIATIVALREPSPWLYGITGVLVGILIYGILWR